MKKLLLILMAVCLLAVGTIGCSKPQLTYEHSDIIFAYDGLYDGFAEKKYSIVADYFMIAVDGAYPMAPYYELFIEEGVVFQIIAIGNYPAKIYFYKDGDEGYCGFLLVIIDGNIIVEVMCSGTGINSDPDVVPPKMAETILKRLSKYSY